MRKKRLTPQAIVAARAVLLDPRASLMSKVAAARVFVARRRRLGP